MIRLTISATGQERRLRPDMIESVDPAPVIKKYHRVYSLVTLVGGEVLECRQHHLWVREKVEEALRVDKPG